MKRLIACSAIAMTALFGVAACGSGYEEPVPNETQSDDSVGAGQGDVARIIEVNGVQCVVVNGTRSTAVSCNWEAYNSKPTS